MSEIGQRMIMAMKRFAAWVFPSNATPTEYHHHDWLLVARHVNPLITDEEFEDQWEEFQTIKARKEMH